jgi:hypothetical protein
MMKKRWKLLAFATLLISAGCIMSGTFTTDVEVTADFNNGFEKEDVDITDVDHAEDIDRIERVDFEAIIRNDMATADTLNVYISTNATYASKAAVQGATDVYPLILGYVTKSTPVPSYDTLTITEARAILLIPGSNWDQIKEIVKTGIFTVYFTSTGGAASGAITEGTLFITFTAAL